MSAGELEPTAEMPSPTAARRLEAQRDVETLEFIRELMTERDGWRAKAERLERELSNASLKSRGVPRP
jgi:hypothetical protein